MKIDTQHLHYWMNAVRISSDPRRTLDAFWSGQIKSKEWLISNLKTVLADMGKDTAGHVEIHGGWVGTLASLLFQSDIAVDSIRSVDIDADCQPISEEMNRLELIENRFSAVTHDMCSLADYRADIVINTSSEHMTQEQYDQWLANTPHNCIVIVQGNNYDIPEHIRLSKDITEFEQQCHLTRKFVGTLELPLYNRYMIIGHK